MIQTGSTYVLVVSGVYSGGGAKSVMYDWLVVAADEEIRLENLRPSTRYVLHIGAKNAVGVGKFMEYSVTTDTVSK